VYAEMSSVNPVFVFPYALDRRAAVLADAYVDSVTGSAGQLCAKPGLVFLVEPEPGTAGDEYVASASSRLAEVSSAPALNPSICGGYAGGIERLEGETPAIAHGRPTADVALELRPALFVTEAERYLDIPVLGEEVFGPASVVVRG